MADSNVIQQEENDMRQIVLAVIMAAGVGLMGISGASAAAANGHAISQIADHSGQITQVRDGCGRGRHRGPHGHCHPN